MDTLKAGDLVRIKSNSPAMAEGPVLTIREVKSGAARCVWFPRPNDPRETTYPVCDLEKI
jgi:uncharacterized protein YodC (DUF2158 family)